MNIADISDNTSSSPVDLKEDKDLIVRLKTENSILKFKNDELNTLNSHLEMKVRKLEQTLEVKNIILKKKLENADDFNQR